jgi:5-formyltetrahydrofolate cyclo-ligase
VLIVPLLAFDARGYRLGYGGGFYDRTLEGCARAGRRWRWALPLPRRRWTRCRPMPTDQRLDAVVTETGVTVFKGKDGLIK